MPRCFTRKHTIKCTFCGKAGKTKGFFLKNKSLKGRFRQGMQAKGILRKRG